MDDRVPQHSTRSQGRAGETFFAGVRGWPMRILISLARFGLGGSETYSATVAEELERLGHQVTLHAEEAYPEGRDMVASRGLQLCFGEPPAPVEVDAIIAQNAAAAYKLASGRPAPRQVFVVHGLAGFEHPPSGLRPHPPVVVLNDRTGRHAAALSSQPDVVRLRQPIDIERFRPRGGCRPRARRVLILSNYLHGDRLRKIERVCESLGLELVRRGAAGTRTIEPQAALADSDIVVGYGRSLLEGMAMGRAAYVWDHAGGDGWVTPESYPTLEADGFSGGATDAVIDADRLREDFGGYRPELGEVGYDLVRNHHSATEHAEALVDLLGDAPSPSGDDNHLETLGLLVRAETRALIRADRLESELRRTSEEREAERARAEGVERQLRKLHELREGERARAERVERQLQTVLRSRSWRLTAPLRKLGARLRQR